jgi:hypothetical protein
MDNTSSQAYRLEQIKSGAGVASDQVTTPSNFLQKVKRSRAKEA